MDLDYSNPPMKLVLLTNWKIEVTLSNDKNLNHKAQLLTYLRFSKITLGYLINFYTPLIKNGITRMVLNHTKYNFAS